ncbi:MAG: M48 family metalloprotease [Terriglobales bacterium]
MGLGLPLLSAMNVSQFRAILAHEFAHYYGGDTRLGPWLRRAQMAMIRTFQTMGSAGRAMRVAIMQVLHIVVFGILKWYWLLFLRAINFVSRRQEFRADELACIVAGPESLVRGLQIVHGATLAWPAYWNQEIVPMLNAGFLPSIAVGFTQFMAAPFVSTQVKKQIEAEIQTGKEHVFDSHPRLRDRIAAAQALPTQSLPCNSQPAWGLLNDGAAWDLAFLRTFNAEMPNNALKRVPWEEHATAVLIPAWTAFVGEYGALLAGVTVQNLFESLGKIPQIATGIRDPKGMLLSPEQRLERARSLLATALGTALIQRGWVLHSRPGELYIECEGQRINPFLLIHRLSDGQITAEEWTAKSQELGIHGISLVASQ